MTINPAIQRYRTMIIIAVIWFVLLLAKGLEVRPEGVTARSAAKPTIEGVMAPITASVLVTDATTAISVTQATTLTTTDVITTNTTTVTNSVPNSVSNPVMAVAPSTEAVANGQTLYRATCAACHGQVGEGVKGLGKDMTTSQFIAGLTDDELLAFIKRGRDSSDPLNTTGVMMPPKGGNPALSDEKIVDIIAFIRSIQKP
jgi:mono/diheme cytochrome c family protein